MCIQDKCSFYYTLAFRFYIIISGRTSVYIDVTKSDDDPFEERGYQRPKLLVKSVQSDAALENAGKGAKRNKTSSRDVLGKFISHLGKFQADSHV